jgi:hypothetical protein
MDITALSTAMSSIKTNNDVGVLMLDKQLELMDTMGDSMVNALEKSVNPHIGGNFDMTV